MKSVTFIVILFVHPEKNTLS